MLRNRRVIAAASLFLILLVCLVLRLIQIQLISPESFSRHHVNLIAESVNQRMQSITLDDGRGKLYDRAGTPIDHQPVPALILFPFLSKMAWPIEKVTAILGIESVEIQKQLDSAKSPFVFQRNGKPFSLTDSQMDELNKLKIPGVFAAVRFIPVNNGIARQMLGGLTMSKEIKEDRYGDRQLAANVKVGDKGLQEQLDEFLLSDGETKLVYHVDGMGGPLFGVNIKYLAPGNPLYPVKVRTTLDMDIQKAAEEAVDENGIKSGGLILIDIDSSEIRASVSRPSLSEGSDPNKGDGAKNRMVQQATLGSVFKTVVSAAALEEGEVNDTMVFDCNQTIKGSPEQERPLGLLNFTESFARSCNRTFGDLAVAVTKKNPDSLQTYAEKLQLIGKSGWTGDIYHSPVTQLYGEESGRIWINGENRKDANLVSQTGIGQQDVQATPLGAANMMATIARGGKRKEVKAVSSIDFSNGTTAALFKDHDIHGGEISPVTAKKLQMLLEQVVEDPNGTAALLSALPFKVAGKTGTAQTNKEQRLLNMWFAGYFPADHPKYAIAAVRLNAHSEEKSATRLVGDFLQKLSQEEELTGE
ncbi:peptidoglycan D,D-transpeptidase FtsI family protein [Bacillus sp. 1P06AnD]|uniref:peptidoglycan D,D-transpeptidase FtsI family protein n=1 Tax=Bacillus sp. 1P06AnD TaxID=3132208 RepID=UPI0039A1B8E9